MTKTLARSLIIDLTTVETRTIYGAGPVNFTCMYFEEKAEAEWFVAHNGEITKEWQIAPVYVLPRQTPKMTLPDIEQKITQIQQRTESERDFLALRQDSESLGNLKYNYLLPLLKDVEEKREQAELLYEKCNNLDYEIVDILSGPEYEAEI